MSFFMTLRIQYTIPGKYLNKFKTCHTPWLQWPLTAFLLSVPEKGVFSGRWQTCAFPFNSRTGFRAHWFHLGLTVIWTKPCSIRTRLMWRAASSVCAGRLTSQRRPSFFFSVEQHVTDFTHHALQFWASKWARLSMAPMTSGAGPAVSCQWKKEPL